MLNQKVELRYSVAVTNVQAFAMILFIAVLGMTLIVANPGYFSHDELQKYDHVVRYGFENYLQAYLPIHQTSAFGAPVRPVSFFVQGVLALFMEHYPVVVHLSAVLTHAVIGFLLFLLVGRFTANKKVALLASLIFILNPLVMMSAGWSAALMDRWYVFFGLLAFLAAEKYVRQKESSPLLLILLLLCSTLAILSKETAMILPGLMLLLVACDFSILKSKRFWLAGFIWALPIIFFLAFRLTAILGSFGDPQVSDYKASVTNIPDNLLVYSAYPFSYALTEANGWVFLSVTAIALALAVHAVLVFILGMTYGLKSTLTYVAMYFLFLAPVILIPIKGAHYMYGSSLVLSTALAAIFYSRTSIRHLSKAFVVFALAVLLLHSFKVQKFIYDEGQCMNRAMTSTEALYLSNGKPDAVDFQAEPDAPGYVLHKINTGREQIAHWAPVKLTVSNWGDHPAEGTLSLAMNSTCLVYKK
ncbi:hypothetical protein [Pseudomonas sp.]|uniref:hypothetical protein n=1 Tax=Pseudomonas sp. TaxID=306 RepID=UPI0028A5BCBE|nr:hypothetical protein [Pseudomonas sp.]